MKVQLSAYALLQNLQVADGTFLEEPGSGAVATIDNKTVSVGTLEWISRYLSLILLSWSKIRNIRCTSNLLNIINLFEGDTFFA